MAKVTILSGVPGSGKSHYVKGLRTDPWLVYSADDWFMSSGSYVFVPAQLPQAHGACLRSFVEYVVRGVAGDMVVDNTNTTVAEIAPYAALALAYGHTLEIITIECDPAIAAARNVHGVPLHAIKAMTKRLAARELPPWWPHTVIPYTQDQGLTTVNERLI